MQVEDVIAELRKERSFAEILRAIAHYTKQRDDWSLATHHLLMAAAEVEMASRRIVNNKKT
ncbi:MAG: hypothetical protein F6K28_49530 [Microcoleus sp. SIO2G3]|nr:hypothetical protein [Microcoleus sp. SIO2G3]